MAGICKINKISLLTPRRTIYDKHPSNMRGIFAPFHHCSFTYLPRIFTWFVVFTTGLLSIDNYAQMKALAFEFVIFEKDISSRHEL